ncbi:CobW family GTP-binding protein [Geminicoccus roseus]|uniref:CobW family GTP-binding protein n=1 Tax=Geminicoccus roseus TaxID=404900 RepID=UPI0003FF26CD|nr:GTP-binding protein [Geminicoccus roseus]
MSGRGDKIPVDLLTGFLGSGKTTLLARLLASPAFADAAVLINEFGMVGLDHLLVEAVDPDTLLLSSGCICCTIRDDLATALRELWAKRERGQVPPFRRVVIETTGLADPTPIVAIVGVDPMLRWHFRIGRVIATVDAVAGRATLARHDESRRQAAIADRLVVTKADLAEATELSALEGVLREINPAAPIARAVAGELPDAAAFLDAPADEREVRRWLAHVPAGPRHGQIGSFVLAQDEPIEWAAFGVWLSLLLHRHGDRILRVKGLVHTTDHPSPVVLQGVQHVVYPPSHLPAWPDGQVGTRLVFIGQDLDPVLIRRSFHSFQRLGRAAAGGPAGSDRLVNPATA